MAEHDNRQGNDGPASTPGGGAAEHITKALENTHPLFQLARRIRRISCAQGI